MGSLDLPFDPLERSRQVEKLVMDSGRRKYYRFRSGQFYGGIVTADAVGCSFLCAYCWNYSRNLDPAGAGTFFSPEEVVARVLSLARKHRLNQIRVSGAEPLLGPESLAHLVQILEGLSARAPDCRFILETNGLMLGQEREFARSLSRFKNLRVRVCLKATDRDRFQLITGALRDYFFKPIAALLHLKQYGVKCWPALTADLFTREEIRGLQSMLVAQSLGPELELEELILYPFVEKNLKERGVELARGHQG
ncbi:MAG: radical SAM protein [Candidatus Saccharicenans sp.]|nr:radical SAM protein [Candidatus Saccharicenans sp.]MDH7494216.1 radical SAM protein [Candidatus Saccharicenans sp.]